MRAPLLLLVVPLASLGSCGGRASSTRHDEAAGGTAGSSGGSSNAGASATGGMGRAGTPASNAGGAGASSGGRAGASSGGRAGASSGGTGAANSGGVPDGGAADGGAADGGAADGGSSAGAGGEDDCIDVCALHGSSCCVPSVACVAADARCVIDVFDMSLFAPVYEYADLEQAVASLPQRFSASVSSEDIESAGADPPAAARIEMHLSPAASALYGALLEGAYLHPFRLSCDGQSLFLGQINPLQSAAGIGTPVLHVSRDVDDSVILRLGARQNAWALNVSSPLEDRERLDQPQLRATLCLAGPLPVPPEL